MNSLQCLHFFCSQEIRLMNMTQVQQDLKWSFRWPGFWSTPSSKSGESGKCVHLEPASHSHYKRILGSTISGIIEVKFYSNCFDLIVLFVLLHSWATVGPNFSVACQITADHPDYEFSPETKVCRQWNANLRSLVRR